MKHFFLLLLCLSLATVLPALSACWGGDGLGEEPMKGSLYFSVDNVREAKGTIWVGIYESADDFLDREKARLVAVKVTDTGQAIIEVPDMVFGKDYALGIFHDENDNGEFDTNFIGLPAEPWAFSGTLKSRFRLPKFEEVSFTFRHQAPPQVLRLRTWF
ncbi:DUF2141 domain-containing protein [Neolewinella persica]|uniref:DUF2141 domain-containing protein n=1 Tax=Neolewinella persica TaxID=70998 RepID=UPI000365B549|nr:DUF2141 domain-containing protein [Neolewinella persica]